MGRRRRDDATETVDEIDALRVEKDWSYPQLEHMVAVHTGTHIPESTLRQVIERDRPPSPRTATKMKKFVVGYRKGRRKRTEP